jgi:23S rRNA (uracil1939-C5)-methyltransferase
MFPATLRRSHATSGCCARAYALNDVTAVDMFPRSAHVETVVLLSKLNAREHITVDLDMSELDVTAAESKATYDEIKAYVQEKNGLKVSSLYISQVKRKLGLETGESFNQPKSENAKVPHARRKKRRPLQMRSAFQNAAVT